jgi:hypothetical protein
MLHTHLVAVHGQYLAKRQANKHTKMEFQTQNHLVLLDLPIE